VHDVMKTQHDSFLGIAAKIATVHDSISRLRDEYLNHEPRNSSLTTRNPFGVTKKTNSTTKAVQERSLSEIASKSIIETNQQQPGHLFNVSTIQPANNSLFSKPGGSIFGQNSGTSLFSKTPTQTTGTSLFGQPAASTTPVTGLFGQPPTSAPGTGLFGQPSTSTPGTGLFGQPSTSTPGTGLFGQPAAQPATATGFGIF
ncbi:hypothetical protein HK096_007465, partial [Nowakowskiella sp. JEL0078]